MVTISGEEVTVHAGAEAFVALYDTQAKRLHAYCWSLVGDQAAAAVRDVFTAAAHPYMTGRTARRDPGPDLLWLYRQARAECLRRGPVTVIPGRDPLLRAAARLRADQREVLVLAADLPPAGIAQVLGVTSAKAIQSFTDARARLEQAVLKVLLADPATATHEDVIAAFERGALGSLLARRAPAPPPGLRASVIGTVTRHRDAPLVVISPAAKPAAADGDAPKGRTGGRHARVAAPVIGAAAACAAAVVGALAAGTTLNFDVTPAGGGGHGAMAPGRTAHPDSGPVAAPGGGQTPVGEVSPTGSAAPRPIERSPGDAPSPAASTSPADPSAPPQAASPDESPGPSGGSPGASTPSSPSTPSTPVAPSTPSDPSPPDSGSPSGDPSDPPGGLLPSLPLLPTLLGGTVGAVTGH
jgi:DNA-directed RNA polymerase specialized sigma24 family protein